MEGEANAFAATIEKLHQDGAQHILIDDFNGQGISWLPLTPLCGQIQQHGHTFPRR